MVRIYSEETKCIVKFGKQCSEEFKVTVRLKLDDALSPTLFSLTLEYVIRKIQDTISGITFV